MARASARAGARVLVFFFPEIAAAEGLVRDRLWAAEEAAADRLLGRGEVRRVVAGQMPLQVRLDVEALAVGAVGGVAGQALGRAAEGGVVGLLDVGELLAAGSLGALVVQVVDLELGRIEVEAAALGPRRGPGHRYGPRRRVGVVERAGSVARQAGGAGGGEAAAAGAVAAAGMQRRAGEQQDGRQPLGKATHFGSPFPQGSVPRMPATSIPQCKANKEKRG